ncbi:hypothetical protein B7C42_08159 [Nocardia cerradoensis]|uniref:Uncharacterized protein n=1 Tax=Nocardia cerradoensis TaxID=85688 RepID=A0A231GT22_9NOCA|nr:hypothetical protein B7C42_08159 [Nocardia cerradoensis]
MPAVAGQLIVGEPAPRFDHADGISLFDQAQRGDAAPESGADDQYIEGGGGLGHVVISWCGCRR